MPNNYDKLKFDNIYQVMRLLYKARSRKLFKLERYLWSIYSEMFYQDCLACAEN